jgi:DNA-damage-inducible protein J
MAETTNFSVRMDKQIKQESEALFQELGMNLTTAINVFFETSCSYWWLSF